MTLGHRLHQLRRASGMSQRELAQRLGVSFTYLSKLENDRMEGPPSEDLLLRLASELGANADELLLLARRVPSDVVNTILEHPEAVDLLRSMQDRSQEDWVELMKQVKRRSEGR